MQVGAGAGQRPPMTDTLDTLTAAAVERQTVFTVYGGHVAAGGTATLSGAGLVLGDACAVLFILCLLTWRDLDHGRTGRSPCLLRRGPRRSADHAGGHVGVNVFSGIVATIVVVLAQQMRQRGQVLRRRARRDHLDHADQLPAVTRPVEAAPQPPDTARSGARLPAADRAPDDPVATPGPADRPGLGKSWRQRPGTDAERHLRRRRALRWSPRDPAQAAAAAPEAASPVS